MIRNVTRFLCLAALAVSAACGGTAPPSDANTWNPNLREFPLTGVIEPAAGRFQLVAVPQAALQAIPEDANGNATTAALGTAQIYGANVFYASGGSGYPAGCNTQMPQVMYSNVEVLSGSNEQLRNVYAKLTTISGGQTFCTKDAAGGFSGQLGSYVGLYNYEPLNPVTTGNTAIRRSKTWALNLPDNGTFYFSGSLLAEVFPVPPTITVGPAEGNTLHTGAGPTSVSVTVTWTNDTTANGSNPEPLTVARPNIRGARYSIYSCGSSALPFVAGNCTTVVAGGTNVNTAAGGSFTRTFNQGLWYQVLLRSRFYLPGSGTTYNGSFTTTRNFAVVKP